jgi:flavin-dependent dehydrogenase
MTKGVVIVGGGTAGWMTAAYLQATFAGRVPVTVVESENVPTIGVGEATFSTVRHFFEYLGLAERDWMPQCHASFKLAIRFEDWNTPGGHFYHPFERPRTVRGFSLADWWLSLRPGGRYDQETSILAALCDAKRSPRYLGGSMLEQELLTDHGPAMAAQFPYAYHFDAALLARFLTGFATERGVRHVLDTVSEVRLDERGDIRAVLTAQHGEISGDLFIDCTGFRGLLLNQALGVPFESYQDTLPNDRAVALRVPVDGAVEGMRPCTTATAREAGWIWTIPLFGRIGTGYVYSSDYLTPEQAERTLREFVGPRADGLEANHIRMRIGRSARSWANNCVAIGLSSGFVEPLESTGIFFIHNAVEQLVRFFPDGRDDDSLRDAYNRQVAGVMDGVREFLVLHYRAAARNDTPYWQDAKSRRIPDALADRLERWRTQLPGPDSIFPAFHGFESYSYTAMLLGLGGRTVRPLPVLSRLDRSEATKEFRLIRKQARTLVEQLPSQYDYLAHQRETSLEPAMPGA